MQKEAKDLREFVQKAVETKFVTVAQGYNLTCHGRQIMRKGDVWPALRERLM
jgi:hypothetical protein